MIQFNEVSKGYGGDELLSQVSFMINPGERCGLVGRNGSGKTTLLRLMTGEESVDAGKIALPKNYRLGFLQQHILFKEPSILKEVAVCLPLNLKDEGYRAEKILSGMGFSEEDMACAPREFSGGYQLRVHLAKVLVAEPDCLLLDEPTNYLDIVSIRWLERFLKGRKGELIVISHDRQFMDSITTHTLAVHRRKVMKERGGTERLFNLIAEQEEIYQRTVESVEKKRERMEAFVRRFGAKATKASQAQSRKKMLENLSPLQRLAALDQLEFHFTEAPLKSRWVMEAKELCFSYEAKKSLIEKFSLEVANGEKVAIVGKNGRGKSTLLRLFAGELCLKGGSLKFSQNVKVGYFGQTHREQLDPQNTVLDEIASANVDLSDQEVRRIAGMMMFEGDRAKKRISVLSGGEKSRVLLGKILASPCNLLLLDEPTNHLDIESVEALLVALKQFSGTVIMVTHDEAVLRALATKLVVCRKGSQREFLGTYDQFLEKWGWEEDTVFKPVKPEEKSRERRRQLVAERNRMLAPLKKEIDRLEKSIVQEEEILLVCQEELAEAAQKGDGASIGSLSKKAADGEKKIEQLFGQLEAVSAEYHQLLESFDARNFTADS